MDMYINTQKSPGTFRNYGRCTCENRPPNPRKQDPPDPHYKIIVRTREKKLDLFRNDKLYKTYPVAIGKPSTPTPKGNFRIINKDDNPSHPQFGAKWLGLSVPHIGIHGTNHPASIGHAVSDGCVRMHNRDILELYYMLPLGTPVSII